MPIARSPREPQAECTDVNALRIAAERTEVSARLLLLLIAAAVIMGASACQKPFEDPTRDANIKTFEELKALLVKDFGVKPERVVIMAQLYTLGVTDTTKEVLRRKMEQKFQMEIPASLLQPKGTLSDLVLYIADKRLAEKKDGNTDSKDKKNEAKQEAEPEPEAEAELEPESKLEQKQLPEEEQD